MYLTRKKPLSHLKRLDRVFDGKPHAHSECWLKWPRLRKQYRKFIRDTMKFCTVVLGLATSHSTKLLQICRDDQSRYHNLRPPSSLGSRWNEIRSPLHMSVADENKTERSFASIQMLHTHTLTHKQTNTHTHTHARAHTHTTPPTCADFFYGAEHQLMTNWRLASKALRIGSCCTPMSGGHK